MTAGKPRARGGRIGGVLFGGIFAAVGFGFLFLSIIPTLYEGWQMQRWQPVEASVLAVSLNTHRGEDSTTYSVSTRYRYAWRGQSYTGSRVGISSGSDNVGDWHQQHFSRLRGARDSASPITVWVDPQAPANAVIDRDIRWGLFAFKMLFVVIFGGVGLAIIVFSLRHRRARSESSTPWLDNPAWRDNRIRSGGRATMWFLWLFGIVWSLLMIPLWLNADELRAEGMPLALLPYLFPLIGMAVLLQAMIKTLRWRRFGDALLSLAPFPGDLDGRIAGHIELPFRPGEPADAEVRLSCLHVYWRRSGNKRERREEVLWQDSRRGRILPGAQGGRIAFDFRPPAGLPPSSEGSDHHRWVVAVHARLSGPDLDHHFTIPVFPGRATAKAASSKPGAESAAAASRLHDTAATASAESLPEWLRLGYRAGGMALYLPLFRNLAMAIPMMLVGGIFAGVGAFLLPQGDAPVLFSLAFALIGTGLFLGGLYSLGNSLEVMVSSRGVSLTRRIFGLPLRRTIAVEAIRGLDKRIGAQSGSNAFYRVFVTEREGRRTTLADSLPSASAADYLIAQISRQLRLGDRSR